MLLRLFYTTPIDPNTFTKDSLTFKNVGLDFSSSYISSLFIRKLQIPIQDFRKV